MPNILPTELFPLRHEVLNANSARLRALPHALHTFHSHDTFPNVPGRSSSVTTKPSSTASLNASSSHVPHKPTSTASENNKRQGLLSGILAEKTLELKKGAQVMLVKNVDEMLVNGCVGQVTGFFTYREVMNALNGENEKRAGATKSTGFVRNVKIGPDGCLIRVKDGVVGKENVASGSGDGVESKVKAKAPAPQKEEVFPMVEFPTSEGGKEAVLVMREEFKVEDSEGKVLARRMQVSPLTLADTHGYLQVWPGSLDPRLGNVDPQKPGSDHSTGEGRPRQSV
jgi:ATP-dependent DNA helicase PIF1